MRSPIPQPCIGASDRVLRTSISSVPGTRASRSSDMPFPLGYPKESMEGTTPHKWVACFAAIRLSTWTYPQHLIQSTVEGTIESGLGTGRRPGEAFERLPNDGAPPRRVEREGEQRTPSAVAN